MPGMKIILSSEKIPNSTFILGSLEITFCKSIKAPEFILKEGGTDAGSMNGCQELTVCDLSCSYLTWLIKWSL